jgi:hypothetical protein
MGSGPSSLTGSVSREKLLKGTAITRDIIDIIFDFLLRNIRLRDFYSLSSPDRCRRYVLFTANQLYSKFIQFQIEPRKGKEGVIFFRSVGELTDPPKAAIGTDPLKDERLQQQKLCLQLAYFYVRILQIYGALALTLIDDSKFMVEHGYTKSFLTGMSIEPPGKLPYYSSGPLQQYSLGPQKKISGGGLYDKEKYKPIPISEIPRLDLFRCLYSILYVPITSSTEYSYREKTYIIKFERGQASEGQGPGISITIRPREIRGDTKIQKAEITLQTGVSNKVVLFVTAESKDTIAGAEENIHLNFDTNVEFSIGGKKSIEYGILDDFPKKFVFIFDDVHKIDGVNFPIWEVYLNRKKYPVETVMRDFFEKVYKKVKVNIKPALLERYDDKPVTKDYSDSTQWTEDRDVNQHLRIKPIIDGMTRKRKFGHCVGRALQLLTTIPSLSGMRDLSSKATSSICDLKFSSDYVDTPTGISLNDTASISSLANLFYDTIISGYPRPELKMDDNALPEYIQFIKQMSVLFMDKEISEADIIRSPQDALRSIKAKESAVCEPKKKPIVLDNTFAMKFVYPYVQELFRQQLVHASNCAKIFVQLFDIRKEGERYQVRIHPNVISKGLDEINRLSRITRSVLLKYYSNCETTYLAGLKNIENGIKDPASGVDFVNTRPYATDEPEENSKETVLERRDKEKELELLRKRYSKEELDEYMRKRRIREERDYYDRDNYRDDYRGYRMPRYGGLMTRKRKSK